MLNVECLVYDETPLWSAPFGMTLLRTVKMIPGVNILDIGSGGGFPMLELAERFGSGSHVYGLDPSEDSKGIINEKIRAKQISNASVTKGVAEDIPFEDGFFGLITANNGLNNVSDVKKSLDECYRVARQGAQMVVTVNLPGTFREFYDVYEAVLAESGLNDYIPSMKAHIDSKRKPVEYWTDKFESSGFLVMNSICEEFSYRYASGSAFLSHYFIRRAFMDPWKSFIPETLVELLFQKIEDRLNKMADEKGELKMAVPFVCIDCKK
jgi:arsenite methyltransferase